MAKFLQLNERDKNLLMKLHDFIYLDSKTVHKYIYDYSTISASYQRLKRLEDFEYVKSHKVNAVSEDYSGSMYTLDKAGINFIKEWQGESRWQYRWTNNLQQWYIHNIYIARTYFAFKEHSADYDIKVNFVHETNSYFQYGNSQENDSIRPDGFIVLTIPDTDSSFVLFLEMERSVTNKIRVNKKLNQYEGFLSNESHRGRFYNEKGLIEDVGGYIVLFIALHEKRERFLKKIFNSILPNEGESISNSKPGIDIPVKLTNIQDIEDDALGHIYNDVRNRGYNREELF